jgi:predicted TIM-barrel fold metal-dependent hydrolase
METRDAYLVERYWPGANPTRVSRADEQVRRAVRDLAQEGTRIRMLGSTFIPAEEVIFTLFEAAREADVVEAHTRSGVRFDRLQPVEVSYPGCKENLT